MHGLGNDFVVIDTRSGNKVFFPGLAKYITDRRLGVGCDQVVVIEDSSVADCRVLFYNFDGSESSTCGNASRCVASLIMNKNNKIQATLETKAGILQCFKKAHNLITINMGKPQFGWQDIPLAYEADTMHLPISQGRLKDPVALSMGNPHAVFFVKDVNKVPLEEYGPALETHEIFPERANISIAQIVSKNEIYLRVWERGTGETMACGSGSCAALAAAFRRKLTSNEATISLLGGKIHVQLLENGEILMTGPAEEVFTGEIPINV